MVGPRLASDQCAGAALRTPCGAVIVSGRVGRCERLWQWLDLEHLFSLIWWGSMLSRPSKLPNRLSIPTPGPSPVRRRAAKRSLGRDPAGSANRLADFPPCLPAGAEASLPAQPKVPDFLPPPPRRFQINDCQYIAVDLTKHRRSFTARGQLHSANNGRDIPPAREDSRTRLPIATTSRYSGLLPTLLRQGQLSAVSKRGSFDR